MSPYEHFVFGGIGLFAPPSFLGVSLIFDF